MNLLSKDQILAADDIETEEVEIPEWGGTVLVKAMNGKERDAFEASVLRKGRDGEYEPILQNMRAKLLAKTLADKDLKPLFSAQDVKDLGEKSAAVLDRLFTVSSRLSGITQSDVDELVKNSEAIQKDDSGSG